MQGGPRRGQRKTSNYNRGGRGGPGYTGGFQGGSRWTLHWSKALIKKTNINLLHFVISLKQTSVFT